MKQKFKSQVCTTIEQSKKLLELGLKPETADMGFFRSTDEDVKEPYTRLVLEDYIMNPLQEEDTIPAWSLDRLLELNSASIMVGAIALLKYDNTYDDIIEEIEWSIKKGYFYKEYLNE